MDSASSSHSMDLQRLADTCREHDRLYRLDKTRSDPQFCFELFRRALIEQSQLAWEYIIAQYHDQVERWVSHVHRANDGHLEAEDFVNDAFARFWQAPAVRGILNKPPEALGSLLQYLKKCAVHAVLDAARKFKNRPATIPIDEKTRFPVRSDVRSVENTFESHESAAELYAAILNSLNTEEEKIIFFQKFTLSKKAAAIQNEFPEIFTDTARIYRVTENLLKRFRRNPDLQELYSATVQNEDPNPGGKPAAASSLISKHAPGPDHD